MTLHETIEILRHLINPQWVLDHGGLWLLMFIVFAETGLFIGFFLPGDSLLFVTGMTLSLNNTLSGFGVPAVLAFICLSGILGNYAGYWFGLKSGPILYQRESTLFFKKKHLVAAHEFYEKHGVVAIVLARFLPIIRTFAPIVAGIVQMNYKKFSLLNILGSAGWVCAMVLIGFFLGKVVPGLKNHLDLIVVIIVLVTTAPVLYKIFFPKRKAGS